MWAHLPGHVKAGLGPRAIVWSNCMATALIVAFDCVDVFSRCQGYDKARMRYDGDFK
jgi:hypothetical protein